jgi:hypothetical protein
VQKALKFSAASGEMSENSAMTTRPMGSPLIDTSRNTLGSFLSDFSPAIRAFSLSSYAVLTAGSKYDPDIHPRPE